MTDSDGCMLAALRLGDVARLSVDLVRLPTQDMGMLEHPLEALPWDGAAMPAGLPFCHDDDDMRMMLDSNGQDVNNRVGGGAGKRLSLPELQVRHQQVKSKSLSARPPASSGMWRWFDSRKAASS